MCVMSEQINELAGALSKAQGEIEGASKDALNPHFKSRYADLASVWDACRGPLAKNGLAIVQAVSGTERGVKVTTILMHSSGQFIRSELDVPAMKLDAQGLGSATTYGRRYSLAAMVGVAPEDDDGNEAVGRNEPARQQPRREPPQPDTRKRVAAEAEKMTPEEEAIFRGKINSFNTLIDAAVAAGDKGELTKVAEMLKPEPENVKDAVREKFRTGLGVINSRAQEEAFA